jgi:hypothetical protein
MAGSDLTVEILKGIREEMRDMRKTFELRFDGIDQRFDRIDQRLDTVAERGEITSQRLDITNERLGVVESTLLTLARRQSATLKYVKATAEHVSRLDVRLTDLEGRPGQR